MHLAEQLRALRVPRQPQVRVEQPRRFFTARENRVNHRQVEVADSDVPAQITSPLWVGNLHLTVKLTVVGQADKPPQLCPVVVQIGAQVQGIKRHRQRRVVDLLGHLHVAARKRHAALWQPLFGGIPGHIGLPAKDAARLGGIRHERF